MNKIVVVFVAVLLFGVGFVSAHGEESSELYEEHHMMGGFYSGIFGMGFFGWIFMLLVVVALVLFIVWLVKQLQEKPRRKKR